MIHHIVLFKLSLQGDEKQHQIAVIKEKLEALPESIKALKELRVGVNFNEKEEYDFMLEALLEEEKDIELYALHPLHQAVLINEIKPFLEKRACVDVRF